MRKGFNKWSSEEDQLLRELAEMQISSHMKASWIRIASALNSKFDGNKKPKQCRERYMNQVKFGQLGQSGLNQWSQEQLDLLADLYIEKGPAWVSMTTHFKNKSQNSIKNRFNKAFNSTAKYFQSFKKKHLRHQISVEVLSILLKASNEIIQKSQMIGFEISPESCMLKFRANLVNMCLKRYIFSQKEVVEMVGLIVAVKSRFKSHKMFKNRKEREELIPFDKVQVLSEEYDKVVRDYYSRITQNVKIQPKVEENTQVLVYDQRMLVYGFEQPYYWSMPMPQQMIKMEQYM